MKKIYSTLLFGLFAICAKAVSVNDIAGTYRANYAQYADAMGSFNDPEEKEFTVTVSGNTVTFTGLTAKEFSGTFDEATNTITVAEGAATSAATIEVEDGVLVFGTITPTDEYAIPGIFAVKEGATPKGTAYTCTLDYQAIDFATWSSVDKTATCTAYLIINDDNTAVLRNFFGMNVSATYSAEANTLTFAMDMANYTWDMNSSWQMADLVMNGTENGFAALDKAGNASLMGFYFLNLSLSKPDTNGIMNARKGVGEQEIYTLDGVRVNGGNLKGLYIVRLKGETGRVIRF